MSSFLHHALCRPQVISALKVAAVVGILLNLINQGPEILAGDWGHLSLAKAVLTFFVPYAVATYAGALSSLRMERKKPEG